MLAQGWVFEGEANTKVFACVLQWLSTLDACCAEFDVIA
jgi:hypothetical protein